MLSNSWEKPLYKYTKMDDYKTPKKNIFKIFLVDGHI